MREDVKITGSSDTPVTNDELIECFRYGTSGKHKAWNAATLYYEGNDLGDDVNARFLGYKNNKTGVIFMLQNFRYASATNTTIYHLDGTMSVQQIYKNDPAHTYFDMMVEAMKKRDSLKNWDVVLCSVKDSVKPIFNNLHLWTQREIMPRCDLSDIFQADEVIQKGCKTVPHVKIPMSKETIEKKNNIQELII